MTVLIVAIGLMIALAAFLSAPCDSTNRAVMSDIESWAFVTLDSAGEVGYDTSIEVDSNDKIHVSYMDWDRHDLKYATNAGGSWANYTLDSFGDVGLSTSLAIDSNNKVHISYLDWTNADLKYATNVGGSWTYQTLDSEGDVGLDTSIAVGPDDRIHISYLDWTNYDLKYATNSSGPWVFSTLDSVGEVGFDTSIGVDSGNVVHISYGDWTNEDLKYATNSGGSWAYYTLDSTGFVGYDTSIAVDSDDNVHISYHDEDNACLKYATNSGGSWANYTLDSMGFVGLFTSIAVDHNDSVHVSYSDYTDYSDSDLKYATNAGGSWRSVTLDAAENVGMFTSLTVDSNRKVHISYCDYTNRDLRYVYGTEEAPGMLVEIVANTTSGQVPLEVQFSSQVTGGLGPYTYYWAFGDGTMASSPDPVHTYSKAGTFTVTLVVADSMATSRSVQTTMIVTSEHIIPGTEDPGDAVLEMLALGVIGLIAATAVVLAFIRKRKATVERQPKARRPTETGAVHDRIGEVRAQAPGQEEGVQARPRLVRVEDQLFELKSMRDKGLISDEEYEAKKKELIRKW